LQQTPRNLLSLDRDGLREFFADLDERPYRALQLMRWMFHRGVRDFGAMTDLSRSLRARLQERAEIRPPEVVGEQVSSDATRKWLLRVDSGNCVETVYIPEESRGTLCVSSQVGCALACGFCSTAQQGFARNLDAAEIVGQLWLASGLLGDPERRGRPASRAITNVVLMGMGEPLLNFDNVVTAMRVMLDDNGFGLARRRVTLSTAGVVPAIRRLKDACPVSLAVSLHASDDALRDELVPINRTYPLAELIDACREYLADAPKQAITFEYVMLDGVNDAPAQARDLARLLGGLPAKVNLIPFNPFPRTRYRRSPPAAIDDFRRRLLEKGLVTVTRRTRGDDIDAACGQLAGQVRPRGRVPARRHTLAAAGAGPAAAGAVGRNC